MKSRKAPGPDNFDLEIIKTAEEAIVEFRNIAENMNTKYVLAIFLGITKAFDNV